MYSRRQIKYSPKNTIAKYIYVFKLSLSIKNENKNLYGNLCTESVQFLQYYQIALRRGNKKIYSTFVESVVITAS